MAAVATRFVEPIVQPVPDWTVASVKNALRLHELGDFSLSGLLAEAITRDARVLTALNQRVRGMLALELAMLPSTIGDQSQAKRVADEAKAWWPKRMRRSQIAKLSRTGIMMGCAPGEKLWSTGTEAQGAKWLPKLKLWHPRWLRFRWDTLKYQITTQTSVEEFEPGDGSEWILYAPGGDERPWMEGAVRALAIPWLVKTFAANDWSRASEVYGLGIRKAKVPADGTNTQAVKKFLRDVKRLGSETTIKLPHGFDVEIEMAEQGKAADAFDKLIDKCELWLTLPIVGQNLTTEVKGGGSHGAADVHEGLLGTLIAGDVDELGDFAEQQIMEPYAERNEGSADLAPRPVYVTKRAPDRESEATVLSTSAQAIKTFIEAGVPIDPRKMGEALGLPLVPAAPEDGKRKGQIYEYHLKYGVLTVNQLLGSLGLPEISAEQGGNDFVREGGGYGVNATPPPPPQAPPNAPPAPPPAAPPPADETKGPTP